MKRIVATVLALALMVGPGLALSEAGLANPWAQTTADGLMEALGLALGVPEDATEVSWYMLEEEQLGEARFTWQGEDYTARVMPTDEFEDISGLYVQWDQRQDCAVGRCDGALYRGRDGEDTVDLCLWYDVLTGLMYSVSVADADLDGFDITAAAEQLYIPMQTE